MTAVYQSINLNPYALDANLTTVSGFGVSVNTNLGAVSGFSVDVSTNLGTVSGFAVGTSDALGITNTNVGTVSAFAVAVNTGLGATSAFAVQTGADLITCSASLKTYTDTSISTVSGLLQTEISALVQQTQNSWFGNLDDNTYYTLGLSTTSNIVVSGSMIEYDRCIVGFDGINSLLDNEVQCQVPSKNYEVDIDFKIKNPDGSAITDYDLLNVCLTVDDVLDVDWFMQDKLVIVGTGADPDTITGTAKYMLPLASGAVIQPSLRTTEADIVNASVLMFDMALSVKQL